MRFPGGSVVKTLPPKQETWFRSLGREDPLEKEMTPAPILSPGKSPGQRSLAGYSPWGHRVGCDLATTQQQQTVEVPTGLFLRKRSMVLNFIHGKSGGRFFFFKDEEI